MPDVQYAIQEKGKVIYRISINRTKKNEQGALLPCFFQCVSSMDAI